MSNAPKRPGNPALFWVSMLLTLAVLLPLLGSFVLYSGWREENRVLAAEKKQSGVPIDRPGPETDLTMLVTVARERPGFLLLRLGAPEAVLQICALPGESVMRSPSGPVELQESYRSAGPGRAAELVSETLDVAIDRYLAITPESLQRVWGQLEPPRVNLSSILSSQELGSLGIKDDPVISLRPQDAGELLERLDPGPARRARLEGAVWEAALRQQLDKLSETLPAGLRAESGSLLGNVTAADMFTLEKSLEWLAKQETRVEAEPVPGHYDRRTGRYEFEPESLAFIRERFAKPLERSRPQPPQSTTPDEE